MTIGSGARRTGRMMPPRVAREGGARQAGSPPRRVRSAAVARRPRRGRARTPPRRARRPAARRARRARSPSAARRDRWSRTGRGRRCGRRAPRASARTPSTTCCRPPIGPETSPARASISNGGSWRSGGSSGVATSSSTRVGQVDAAVTEIHLDRRQPAAVHDRRPLAGRAVHERHRAHRARCGAGSRAGGRRPRRALRRSRRPRRRPSVVALIRASEAQLVRDDRHAPQLALAHDLASSARPMRSSVMTRCRSSMSARTVPSSSTSRSSARRPARAAGLPSTTSITSIPWRRPSRPATRGGSGRPPPTRPS